MRWQIVFFERTGGIQPVKAWLDALSKDVPQVHAKMLARIDMLADHGPTLDHPFTSQIEGKLREVRLRFGKARYRVLYFFDPNRVGVLLHAFTKNTEAVEEADKKIGRDRMNAHLERITRRQQKKR